MTFSPEQQAQIDRAQHVLHDGEVVIDATTGTIVARRMGAEVSRRGSILVTDRRVILFTKKIGGYEMNDHVYGLLTALDYKKNMMFGDMTLAASGDRTQVTKIPKSDVERVAKRIREQMAHSHAPVQAAAAPTSASPADEIRKLAGLHAEGFLTDEEFGAKKRQLLSL
jgi:hypothetical protein